MADFMGISGGDEIARALKEFTPNIERNMLRGGLRAGAVVIADEAKSNVPVLSGGLRDEGIKVKTGAKGGKVFARVQARSKDNRNPWQAYQIEYGVKPHVIIAGGGSVLATAARILGEKVDHPGAPAKPFMRPALDAKGQDAIDATAEYLRKRILKGK